MEVQRVSISTLQNQLTTAKEELAVITVERDHLKERLRSVPLPPAHLGSGDSSEVDFLLKKVCNFLYNFFQILFLLVSYIIHFGKTNLFFNWRFTEPHPTHSQTETKNVFLLSQNYEKYSFSNFYPITLPLIYDVTSPIDILLYRYIWNLNKYQLPLKLNINYFSPDIHFIFKID